MLLLLHVILAWILRSPIGIGNDDAIYLQLSRSLRGLSYREEYLIGSSFHSQYPPGYPLLLAAISSIAGERVGIILALTALISAAALGLVFDAVRRLWSPRLALMVLIVSALNLRLIRNAGEIATESIYMALSALALWLLVRSPDRRMTIIMAGAAAIAAAMTRSAGVTLVAAVFFLWLMESRFRRAIIFATTAMLIVGSWLAWTVVAPDREYGRSYIADVTPSKRKRAEVRESPPWRSAVSPLGRVWRNSRSYLVTTLPSHMKVPVISGTLVDNIAWLLLIVICGGVGLVMIWRRQWRSVVLYLILYAGLLVVWAWPVGRFLDPLLPFAFLAILAGAAAIGARFIPRAAWAPPMALTVLIAANALSELPAALSRSSLCDRSHPSESPGCFLPEQRAFLGAAEYARANTPEETRFVSSKEGAFAYHSKRKLVTIGSVTREGPEGILARMRSANVSYVVLGTGTGRESRLIRTLQPVCNRLEVVQTFPPRVAILKPLPPNSVDASSGACAILSTFSNKQRSAPRLTWKRKTEDSSSVPKVRM